MSICIMCKSKSYKRPDLMYHSFPKDEVVRKKWIDIMKIDQEVSKDSKVCSIHFEEDCFRPAYTSGYPRLIRGSIPTINITEIIDSEEDSSDSSNLNIENKKSTEHESNDSEEIYENVEYLDEYLDACSENIEQTENDETNFENSSTNEIISEEESQKRMIEELQYSCQNISLRTLKEEKFRKFTETFKVMCFLEAQEIIIEQDKQLKALQRCNNNLKRKIENLTTFTNSMKKEIAKRAKMTNTEW